MIFRNLSTYFYIGGAKLRADRLARQINRSPLQNIGAVFGGRMKPHGFGPVPQLHHYLLPAMREGAATQPSPDMFAQGSA